MYKEGKVVVLAACHCVVNYLEQTRNKEFFGPLHGSLATTTF